MNLNPGMFMAQVLRKTRRKIPQGVQTATLLFTTFLLAAGCQTPATPTPTPVPTPTSTPDPYLEWTEFIDPWGRYTVRYPPEWHAYPAVVQDVGYASTISTVTLETSDEPSREFEPSQDEFVIWFTFDPVEGTKGVDLMSWAEARIHPGGVIGQRAQETIAGSTVVVEILDLHSGQQAKIVHFLTPNGVLSIIGQPWGNPETATFDLLLTTVSFPQ